MTTVDFFLFHTVTFNAVVGFLQTFWNDGTGRIVLVTFLTYAASYMIYSGYISWFAGGYGGILLTQVGFSVIDLLGLLPMAFLLLIESLWPLVKYAGKFTFFYIILPFLLLWATINILLVGNLHVFPGNAILESVGFLLWTLGLCIGIFPGQLEKHKWVSWLSIALCYFGVVLAGLTAPFASINVVKATIAPFQATQDWVNSILFEGVAVIILIILPITPLFIGRSMASYAAKRKLLSQVQKLVLKQALEIPGALAVEKGTKKKKAASEIKADMFSYYWEKDRPIYLVVSLSKTNALYAPPETTGRENGRMVLLANDLICAMEI